MTQNTLITLCWLVLGMSALVLVGGAAIGAAYHPEAGSRYLLAATAPTIGIGSLLFLFPRVSGVLSVIVVVAVALSGFALVFGFGYRLLVDVGDAMLWAPPLLLGIGLLCLALQRPQGNAKGDKT